MPLLKSTAVFTLVLVALSDAHAEIISLGSLPGGPNSSQAAAVSSDGSTVVGTASSTNGSEAFIWTSTTGMIGLGDLPGDIFRSHAYGVSSDGSAVVGLSFGSGGQEAFRWTSATGMVGLGGLNNTPPLNYRSIGDAVSAYGSVVVGRAREANFSDIAYRWTEATGMQSLGILDSGTPVGVTPGSHAYGISSDGSVIAGTSTSVPGYQAFRWTSADGMVGLGDLPGGRFDSHANAVSGDGSVIVGRSAGQSGTEAFRWTSADGMIGLGDLAGGNFRSEALAASADGSVIVGVGDSAEFGNEAFIWNQSAGMQSLRLYLINAGNDLTGWELTSANGISADGSVIVGTGVFGGNITAWRATVTAVPEPSSLMLLSLSSAILLVRSRRRTVGRWANPVFQTV